MKVFGIAGWSGSGKTTLLVRLIPALVRRGIAVATIKHTHHNPAVGDPECRAMAAAGACETVVASAERFALIHELNGRPEPTLDDLIARFHGIGLLLIEGFKWAPHAKLEVYDPMLGKPLLAAAEPTVVALATDQPVEGISLPRFVRDDIEGVAGFIATYCGL
jgi:molybdopterin-guanine dinucleotide biosynthesis adapter protein